MSVIKSVEISRLLSWHQ